MKYKILNVCAAILVTGWSQIYAATASPVVADYGDVFPTLADVSLNVNRASGDAPWFVKFNLLAPANVSIGVNGIESCNGCKGSFTLTSLRITDFNDSSINIAFGTDSFQNNPFDPHTIDQLVIANNLAPDMYVLAVSGSGNISNYHEFTTHLQVTTPVPLPAGLWLFVSGIIGLLTMRKKA